MTAHLGIKPLEIDEDLACSERFDPDTVPALILLEDDREVDRVEGFERARFEELTRQAGIMAPGYLKGLRRSPLCSIS